MALPLIASMDRYIKTSFYVGALSERDLPVLEHEP